MKNLLCILFSISSLLSYSQLITTGSGPGTITTTEGKIGIGNPNPKFPLSFGATNSNSTIALYESGASVASIGYTNGDYQLRLAGEKDNFNLYSSAGKSLLNINFDGSTIHKLTEDGGEFTIDAGSTNHPMMGIKNTVGWFLVGIGSGQGSYSEAAKKGDIIVKNRTEVDNSNFILANNSINGSILFALRDDAGCWPCDKQKMEIKSDGKVVIGKPSDFAAAKIPYPDGYNLFVANGILTPKVKVAVVGSNWSDFVFAPEYKLPSLEETETFVKINKHLPGIPSAKEMEKNGLDLGAMDALLLQKIEELTLHMIELKKENVILKKSLK